MIEAVTICVNYADFFKHTWQSHAAVFGRIVVVTTPNDDATIDLCQKAGLECVVTTRGSSDGDAFNVGKMMNEGLKVLSRKTWVARVDADIYLPCGTKERLLHSADDPNALYGIDRFLCPTYNAWVNGTKDLYTKWGVWMDKWPLSKRYSPADVGYVPVGFFQLWNAGVNDHIYSEGGTTAANSDIGFALNWPRKYRRMIPDVAAIHLDSEDAPSGANWSGRKTIPFA